MKRLVRWVAIAFAGLACLAVVAYATVYVVSERVLRRTYPVPAATLAVPADPASIAEGRRLATIYGCFAGCHGKQAGGTVFFDDPMIARVVAPNLTAAARRYSDAQLAAIIRNGVRPDGRSMIIMPSEAFAVLTDADLARIVAFIRSLPPVDGPGPEVSPGPVGRLGLAIGKFNTAAELIRTTTPPPDARDDVAAKGRYLARTVCVECHGTSLGGDSNPDFTSPDLRIVGAYSPEAFAALLRTGVGLGGRTLGVMGPTARKHLSLLTDEEIAALYHYLHALTESPSK